MKRNLLFVSLIAASIAVTLLSTVISYRNAVHAAQDFLKSQALGIATSLDTALSRYGTKENIFTDMIESGKWEGIAFLGLYTRDGLTVLHSNEHLIHKKIEDTDVKNTAERGEPLYHTMVLGTGEEVFVLDVPVHLGESTMTLRVALHTYPARTIARGARFQLVSVGVVLSILSLTSIFFLIASRKKEELEKAVAEKEKLSVLGEMASVLAHEIRNPLGSIKGFAQYLKEQIAGQRPQNREVTEEYLDIIVAESKRIETLTEDLLTYARHDDLNTERFFLSPLIRETLSSVPVPDPVSLRVEIPEDIILVSDRNKLRQVVENLAQNAIDAIPGEGSVEIHAEQTGDSVALKVSDSGAGIDEDALTNIFKPFYTTKTKGTGLGLAIVERYIKAIGGKMSVESRRGKGSTFRMVIPLELNKVAGKEGDK
jgi:two-component system sensor histidine kinase HydH